MSVWFSLSLGRAAQTFLHHPSQLHEACPTIWTVTRCQEWTWEHGHQKASLGSGGSSTLSHQPDPFLRSSVTRAWAFVCNPFGNTWTPRPRSRSKGLGKAQLERRDGRLVTAESCHGHSGSSIQIHPYWTVSVFEESASKGLLATGSNNQQAIWIPLLLTSVIFD